MSGAQNRSCGLTRTSSATAPRRPRRRTGIILGSAQPARLCACASSATGVSEQKPPAEIRGHILAIREEIEAYAEKADHLVRLETENAKLIEEKCEIEDSTV